MNKRKRILISVTDKKGLEQFKQLTDLDWEIVSTDGTYAKLKELGIPCILVEEVTNFPEMMNGRVKTLHPNIFAGILADRSKPEHMEALEVHGIETIDMVVVNFYDFDGNPNIENIDIGGPSLLRACAKNGKFTIPIVSPDDYPDVIWQIKELGEVSSIKRQNLVRKVFETTMRYEMNIYKWMTGEILENKEFL